MAAGKDRKAQRKLFKRWKRYLQDSKLTQEQVTKRAKTFSRKGMGTDEKL